MQTVCLSAEMSISHRDFLRLLDAAVEGRAYTTRTLAGATDMEIQDGPHQIHIHLAPERERRLASIRLPVTDVEYRFLGHSRAQAEAVKARFDIYFRRGGG